MVEVTSVMGIDVSKRTFDACVLMNGKSKHKKFSNDYTGFKGVQDWLSDLGIRRVHACMESTGRYYEFLAQALSSDHVVSVINPQKIKGFSQSELKRSKTDKLDAALIARFCMEKQPSPWTAKSETWREVQELERYVDSLKEIRTQEINRLEAGVRSTLVCRSIQQHIENLDQQISELSDSLSELIRLDDGLHKQCELITSVIGIGDATAYIWLGELGVVDRFKTARELESFCGLAPRKQQSGTSLIKRDRMSKIGNSRIRKALYLPALSAMRYNPVIRTGAERLREAGKPGKVIVGAVMRKLLRIIFAILKSGQPFDLDYRSPAYATLAGSPANSPLA